MGLLSGSPKSARAPRPTTLQLVRPLPARIEQHFLATDITEPAGYLEFTKAAHRIAEAAFGAFDLEAYDLFSKEIEVAAARIDEISASEMGGPLLRLGLFANALSSFDPHSTPSTIDQSNAEVLSLRGAIDLARAKQDELIRALFERTESARKFLRELGAGGFLPGAKTVDKNGVQRTVRAQAWSYELNWQQLITDRVFNSGEKGTLVMPGRVFVPNSLLDEITKDMTGRGMEDFRLWLAKCFVEPDLGVRELIIKAADAVVRPGMRAHQRNRAIREYMGAQGWSPAPSSPCDSAIREALRGTKHSRAHNRQADSRQS